MYISYIKYLISNKWRQGMIRLSRKFYVQLFLKNRTQDTYIISSKKNLTQNINTFVLI